jgi:hypothetical protein
LVFVPLAAPKDRELPEAGAPVGVQSPAVPKFVSVPAEFQVEVAALAPGITIALTTAIKQAATNAPRNPLRSDRPERRCVISLPTGKLLQCCRPIRLGGGGEGLVHGMIFIFFGGGRWGLSAGGLQLRNEGGHLKKAQELDPQELIKVHDRL